MSQQDTRETLNAATPNEGLLGALERRERNLALSLRVQAPGRVVTFNAADGTASVELGFLAVEDSDSGAQVPDPPIVIPNVRVEFPRAAAGTCYDTWPLVPGDTGVLSFCDRALDRWYLGTGSAVDPIDGRAHELSDAVFRPTISHDAAALTVDATARVVEHAAAIKLGAGATIAVDAVALARLVHTYLTAMITAAPTTAQDGGAAFKAGLLSHLEGNAYSGMASSKVNAEP